MLFCGNCGSQLETGEKFCGVCGAAVQEAEPNLELAQETAELPLSPERVSVLPPSEVPAVEPVPEPMQELTREYVPKRVPVAEPEPRPSPEPAPTPEPRLESEPAPEPKREHSPEHAQASRSRKPEKGSARRLGWLPVAVVSLSGVVLLLGGFVAGYVWGWM